MFQRKKLLKQCSDDKMAISIINRQRNISFVNMVLSFLMLFVIIRVLSKIEINTLFDSCCFGFLLLSFFLAIQRVLKKLGSFLFLEFDCTETDYINCVLLDNAKIKEFTVLKKDNSYVYILDEYKKLKQIPFCPQEKYGCKEHIKIKRYSQIENSVLEEFYEPI